MQNVKQEVLGAIEGGEGGRCKNRVGWVRYNRNKYIEKLNKCLHLYFWKTENNIENKNGERS
jgi:hypothetical protein